MTEEGSETFMVQIGNPDFGTIDTASVTTTITASDSLNCALDKISTSALAAWSRAELLRAAWLSTTVDSVAGPLIRLRRDSDNAQLSFSCDANGLLDTTSIVTWLGGGSAHIVKVYDQSGSGHHLVQNTAANQEVFSNSLMGTNARPGGTAHASNSPWALTSAGTGGGFDGLLVNGGALHAVYRTAQGSTKAEVLAKPFEWGWYDDAAPASNLKLEVNMTSGSGNWQVTIAPDTVYVDSLNYDGSTDAGAVTYWRDGVAITATLMASGSLPPRSDTFDLQWRANSMARSEEIIFAAPLSAGDLQTLNQHRNAFFNA